MSSGILSLVDITTTSLVSNRVQLVGRYLLHILRSR
jgi:hypothetical protein